jgi:alpha/beta superfamily hydrolase
VEEIRMTCATNTELVRIPVENGTLAAELAYPDDRPAFAAVIVNPHPHMGGSMQNNLVTALAERLAETGVTLRFDYRGVGESDGTRLDLADSLGQFWRTGNAPEDPLMVEDARAAIRWLGSNIDAPLIAIGYSFGAYAAVRALDDDPAALILVSPTITQHDFKSLDARQMPTLVIFSDNDFATPAVRTWAWASQLPFPVLLKCCAGAEHFFRGQETSVSDCCAAFIESTVRFREGR